MKHFIATVLLGLGLSLPALAGTASGGVSSNYNNPNLVTTAPVVDAPSFVNSGEFDIETVAIPYDSPYPFSTTDTYYYTNTDSGLMVGEPGWLFNHGTTRSRNPASSFLNQGTIEGVDGEADIGEALVGVVGSKTLVAVPANGQPLASQILVQATNIMNPGAMSVGDAGLLSLVGSNVNLTYGTLSAGFVSTVGLDNSLTNATGLAGQEEYEISGAQYFFLPSPGVYDIFWGITNGSSLGVDTLSADLAGLTTGVGTFLPSLAATPRGLSLAPGSFPINSDTAQWSVSAILYTNAVTNIYYNILFVNTNFSGANITATAGFTVPEFPEFSGMISDANPVEDIVQFAEPVKDILTGQTVTNGVYLIDDGAYLPTLALADNASTPDNYSRPNNFAVTTETPLEWIDVPLYAEIYGSYFYDPTLIYTKGIFNNNKEPLAISEYGAQIGRNPASISGSFSTLADTTSLASIYLTDFIVNLPDPTNEPARIELRADNLTLTQSRLRAEGLVILNATNLIGAGAASEDFGQANASIGVSSGVLNFSNIFPTNFQRVRGDIYAWSATWQNTQTNTVAFSTNTNNFATNIWHYHVTVVDQNLFGSFPSTERNLTLTAKDAIVLRDNLNVINQAVINTPNLTIESSNYFSQNALNFTSANTPHMKNLFINTNGFLGAQSLLDVGFNAARGPAGPTGRAYSVNTITNFGQLFALSPQFQSVIFENDGTVTANSIGSILIEASNLCLGLALTNTTNYLQAGGDVTLSAVNLQASNSVINAGLTEAAALTLQATGQLTDFVSGAPTTNTNSVIINQWTVTGGFSLPVKPATGDLFGTEIHTIANGLQQVQHVWAGADRGASPAGFANNEVIGRLVLDRQSAGSVLRFSAAGNRNAMYVDYLVLTNFAFTNYRTGVDIANNFTIYFAACNLDPSKLTNEIPGLVWVPGFAGPNSSVSVYYQNSDIVYYLNANVANSTTIAFWNDTPNYDLLNGLDGMPPYTNLLNDPTDMSDYLRFPGTFGFPCNCTPGANAESFLVVTTNAATNLVYNLLTLSYNGQGTITSSPILQSNLALGGQYTLTAKPAKGWLFDNWITNGTGSAATNFSTSLSFTFDTNIVITANFIPNPFPTSAGAYHGLFFETNAVDPGSSGEVFLTLAQTGSFSGKLLMGPVAYTFSSQFTGSGAAHFPARSGAQSLAVNLQFALTGPAGQIFGDVSNSLKGWDAALAADLAPTWTARNPSPFAGSYTMALPWSTGTEATNEPGGDSYGVGAVSPSGVLTLAGALADGTAFSASAPVSLGGQWPFYIYAASGKDTVLGWVTVSNGLSGTNISWSKAAGAGPLYSAGFTNLLQLVGSPWRAPTKASPTLASLEGPFVTLSGGDLPETLSEPVATKDYLTYSEPNFTLTIGSNGKFTGAFDDPTTGKIRKISGVVLTNEVIARGFFLGTNESGDVLLQGQ